MPAPAAQQQPSQDDDDLKSIFSLFLNQSDGTFLSAIPYGSGHINDTFQIHFRHHHNNNNNNDDAENKKESYYILQRINHNVFPKPMLVMENVIRVTQHLATKVKERKGDVSREVLTLVPTKEGQKKKKKKNESSYYCAIVDGNYWRVYNFISNATSFEIGQEEEEGINIREEAAAAFAQFQNDISDISPPKLHETIANFGDSSFRFQQFQQSLHANIANRACTCQPEVQFCLQRKKDASVLMDLWRSGAIPERVAHYDTKINNVLIDDDTRKGLCVIDLDTTMPGLSLYDFGDCVRAAASLSAEDEVDLTKVGFCIVHFESIVRGYLSVANDFLTQVEIQNLAMAAKVVTFTIALRFLCDYLAGDVYFKVEREGQNLDRARTQLKIVKDMEENMVEMERIVEKYHQRKGTGGEQE